MDARPAILVADDEPNLLSNLVYAFEAEGYAAQGAGDGESAWLAFSARRHDLVVLDILMPRADGMEVLRRIRAIDPEVPVIFLTSKDEEFDKVLGLELGADDYLCKPFSLRELEARVKALLRRSRRREAGGPQTVAPQLAAGGLELDPDRFEARAEGSPMRLTVTEFRVLAAMVAAPGIVKSRDALVAAAYPDETYLSDRAIDCHVKRLRRKIAEAGGDPGAVETVYGLGYRLRDPSSRLKVADP